MNGNETKGRALRSMLYRLGLAAGLALIGSGGAGCAILVKDGHARLAPPTTGGCVGLCKEPSTRVGAPKQDEKMPSDRS